MTSYADTLRSRLFTGSDIATLIEGIFTSTFPATLSSWTPTLTCTGSMSITGTSISSAKYIQIGKLVWFKLSFAGTLGGTPSAIVHATLPVTAATTVVEQFAIQAIDGDASVPTAPLAQIYDTTSKIGIYKAHAGGNWTAGASFAARLSGFYEAA